MGKKAHGILRIFLWIFRAFSLCSIIFHTKFFIHVAYTSFLISISSSLHEHFFWLIKSIMRSSKYALWGQKEKRTWWTTMESEKLWKALRHVSLHYRQCRIAILWPEVSNAQISLKLYHWAAVPWNTGIKVKTCSSTLSHYIHEDIRTLSDARILSVFICENRITNADLWTNGKATRTGALRPS